MKIENYYGVDMNVIEGFKFSIFLTKPENPAMNTLTQQERKEFTEKWLTNYRLNLKPYKNEY